MFFMEWIQGALLQVFHWKIMEMLFLKLPHVLEGQFIGYVSLSILKGKNDKDAHWNA